jgi:hypothetical protein
MESLMRKRFRRVEVASLATAAGALVALGNAAPAFAQDTYRADYRGEYANYPIEIEPHLTFGPDNVYGASGFGGGLRVSIPVVGGYLGNVADNLAISFGGDLVHYDNCYSDACGANYVLLPLAAQWNIFVVRRVSLFVEGGAYIYKGFLDGCGPGDGPCSPPSDFGLLPTIALGARVHFSPGAALTARLGYPTTTIGFSFL